MRSITAARRATCLGIGLTFVLAACGSTPPSAGPSALTSSVPTSPPASAAASAAPSTAPSATPTAAASPAPTVAPSPSSAEACPIAPQTGRLPSDRMTDVTVSSSGTADLVTFTFGNPSVQDPPQGVSEGSLAAAEPPYTQAGSGAEIDVAGDHVAQVRFSGMSLSNDVEELTYDGPLVIPTIDYRTVQVVYNYDMSEGVIGWYIGYNGNGCVTLTSDATSVTVAIDHPTG